MTAVSANYNNTVIYDHRQSLTEVRELIYCVRREIQSWDLLLCVHLLIKVSYLTLENLCVRVIHSPTNIQTVFTFLPCPPSIEGVTAIELLLILSCINESRIFFA